MSAQRDIVAAVWELAREHGPAGFSLRDLVRRLGMATPSLYSYFVSKQALYDAMFIDGNRVMLAMDAPAQSDGVRTTLGNVLHFIVQFSLPSSSATTSWLSAQFLGSKPSTDAYAWPSRRMFGCLHPCARSSTSHKTTSILSPR
jgi:AcrR family transcriptional regulator